MGRAISAKYLKHKRIDQRQERSWMMTFLTQVRWSPYAVGVGIGVLSWLSFLILKETFGQFNILCKNQRDD
jgi:hypothetical protein